MADTLEPEHHQGESPGVDYQPWGIEGTRLQFRGPPVAFDAPFVAVLGGTETYGKYVDAPYPKLLAEWVNMPVANLGIHQAGLTLFAEERCLLETASRANVCVLQLLGAQNMSNRLYSVHARRNDRFLGVSPALRDLYPNVDFAEVNFTGHLLSTLSNVPNAFEAVVDELKWAWVQRMRRIVQLIETDVILLWVSDRHPDATKHECHEGEPTFVDHKMIDMLRDDVWDVVEVVRPGMHRDVDGMVFSLGEIGAAESLPCPADHARIAEALGTCILEKLSGSAASKRARA